MSIRRKKQSLLHYSHGFTLIELMTVLAISAVLLLGGWSALKNYIPNEDVRLMAHQLQSSLLMARSEAVKRSANTYLTPSASGYEGGWIISTLQGRSFANCTVAAPPDDCIYVFQNDRPIQFDGLANQVVYNRQGRIPIGSNLSVSICDDDESSFVTKRMIQVNPNGFPKILVEGNCEP